LSVPVRIHLVEEVFEHGSPVGKRQALDDLFDLGASFSTGGGGG
jgi:hypothetical protein